MHLNDKKYVKVTNKFLDKFGAYRHHSINLVSHKYLLCGIYLHLHEYIYIHVQLDHIPVATALHVIII